MNARSLAALVSTLWLSAGCGGSAKTDNATEQAVGACTRPPLVLSGAAAEGAACSVAADCKPSCCTCDSGGKSWSAASCVGGKCAAAATACANTKNDAMFCR